ncbi:MAG: hypothetical protein LBE34_15395 [Flavobacteriaceae bacterium]|nr:hypothetical protein [Flavobacteriaceae bacterium]
MKRINKIKITTQVLRTLLFVISAVFLSMGMTCNDDDYLKTNSLEGKWQLIATIQYNKEGKVVKTELPIQRECPQPTFILQTSKILDVENYKKEGDKCIKYTEGIGTWEVKKTKFIVTKQSDKSQTIYNMNKTYSELDLEYMVTIDNTTFDSKTTRVIYQFRKIKNS